MDFSHKKIFIAPHTAKTTMLAKVLKANYEVEVLGFIDKEKKQKDIFQLENILNSDFDLILIYSPNHFHNIYKQYKKQINSKKIIYVDVQDNKYIFNDYQEIFQNILKNIYPSFKLKLFEQLIRLVKWLNLASEEVLFISKDFIGTNNKMLFIEHSKNTKQSLMLTDNKEQFNLLKNANMNVAYLGTLYSYLKLAMAKTVIQDQGNSNYLLKHLSPKQTTIQLWHGIPLKRMNLLVDVVYDYHISPSDFVNDTSLSKVIQANVHLNLGYPRNDLLHKEHTDLDLLFVNKELYNLAKRNKTIVYMPTHRESTPVINEEKCEPLPLDFDKLNDFLKTIESFFILKLHPFVSKLYNQKKYTNIIFYNPQDDIYPLLKYTDLLITDYSSVYFDFLLLDKPIVFFNYDYEEYASNMNGFVYNYDENTPGDKVKTQEELQKSIINAFSNDGYKTQRKKILSQYFTYQDSKSSHRIVEKILMKEAFSE